MSKSSSPTLSKILEAAWELVADRGVHFFMQDVAAAAGVSRQTVYLHVGSRAGLFVAMARHHDARAGIGERFERAFAEPSARQALAATIRTWFEYVPSILPVARALRDASSSDEDAAAAWWDRMDAVRARLREMVERLEAEGELTQSLTVEEATDLIWWLTHLGGWDDLVGHWGWDPDHFVDRQVELAELILVGPRATPRRMLPTAGLGTDRS